MYRQFFQQPIQPLPGQTWDFMQPIQPTPMPMQPMQPMQPMTFEEMYRILGEMYEMIRCIYEHELAEE